jgi:hypothetical protein
MEHSPRRTRRAQRKLKNFKNDEFGKGQNQRDNQQSNLKRKSVNMREVRFCFLPFDLS